MRASRSRSNKPGRLLLPPGQRGGFPFLDQIRVQAHQEISQILPNLFLSNAEEARKREKLDALGIDVVVMVADDVPEHERISGENRVYLHFPASENPADLEGVFRFLPQLLEIYQISRGPAEEGSGDPLKILVHCYAGVNRSATVVIVYLMCFHGYSLEEAYDLVRAARPIINPSPVHRSRLNDLERSLNPEK